MQKGNEVVIYSLQHNRVWDAKATYLIEENSDDAVLWMPAGSQFAVPRDYQHNSEGFRKNRWRNYRDNDWHLLNRLWLNNHVLVCKPKDAFYSVMHFWSEADNEFLGYYVNFELPYEKTDDGFVTLDLDLDIMIYPDYSWEMKDEEDYQNAVDEGHIPTDWVNAIALAQEHVMADMMARRYPFDGHWLAYPSTQTFKQSPRFPEEWARRYGLLDESVSM